MHDYTPAQRVNDPDNATTSVEVLGHLPTHLGRRIAWRGGLPRPDAARLSEERVEVLLLRGPVSTNKGDVGFTDRVRIPRQRIAGRAVKHLAETVRLHEIHAAPGLRGPGLSSAARSGLNADSASRWLPRLSQDVRTGESNLMGILSSSLSSSSRFPNQLRPSPLGRRKRGDSLCFYGWAFGGCRDESYVLYGRISNSLTAGRS